MVLKRLFGSLLIALVLVACGGSSEPDATATPPATPTARATPTERPTATTEAAEPSGTSAIPAPPNSRPYQKGEDQFIDIFVDAMSSGLEGDESVSFTESNYYLSEATPDEIVSFYQGEMPGLGWSSVGDPQVQEFGTVIPYLSNDSQKTAIVAVFDLGQAGSPGVEGIIVFTAIGNTADQGGGTTDQPTSASGTINPPAATDDIGGDLATYAIPVPPQSQPYNTGDDTGTDAFLEGFSKGLEQGFGEESGYKQVGQAEFVSQATPEEIKAFYDAEMEARGWPVAQVTPNEQAQILNYARTDANGKPEVVVIASVDRAQLGADGQIVVVLVATQR